jgi:molybdenum cofactor biosynthesis enzyme MoaA
MDLNYYELEPENNIFEVIYADVTHKCNMACANCFIPNRTIPDMDLDSLVSFLKRLPNPIDVRLIGAEPTLRNDLFDIISSIKKIGHRPVLMTNGLKLADLSYVKNLYQSGLRRVNISMTGADDDDVYVITDKLKCANQKVSALKNVSEMGFRIGVGAILIKELNEHIPERLFEMVRRFRPKSFMMISFRNVGYLGRYSVTPENNFSFTEMVDLLSQKLKLDKKDLLSYKKEYHQIRYPLDKSNQMSSVWLKITDWAPYPNGIPDPNSKRRGRITTNFKIAPAFEHVKLNENGY